VFEKVYSGDEVVPELLEDNDEVTPPLPEDVAVPVKAEVE